MKYLKIMSTLSLVFIVLTFFVLVFGGGPNSTPSPKKPCVDGERVLAHGSTICEDPQDHSTCQTCNDGVWE